MLDGNPEGAKHSTRDRLLDVVDDLDLICRQLAEVVTVCRELRSLGHDLNVVHLLCLFKSKEQQLNALLKIAEEQLQCKKYVEALEEEVRNKDQYIGKIRNCFLESEDVLINAIFQANQKLKSIAQSEYRKVTPDELIRYAHRISVSNSVASSASWKQGDPERPYPRDCEMRAGWLSRLAGCTDYLNTPLMNGGLNMSQFSMQMGMDSMHGGGLGSSDNCDPSGAMAPPRLAGNCWLSPRNVFAGHQVSPRVGGGGGVSGCLPNAASTSAANVASSPTVGRTTCFAPQAAALNVSVKTEPSSVEDTIEVLSSDSSSTSSSDSPE